MVGRPWEELTEATLELSFMQPACLMSLFLKDGMLGLIKAKSTYAYSLLLYINVNLSHIWLTYIENYLILNNKIRDKITFAEVNCTGEGANKQGRAA